MKRVVLLKSVLEIWFIYDLAKFLALILKLFTKNEYPVHHSFSKASEVSKFIFKSLKASINVESLFTKVL